MMSQLASSLKIQCRCQRHLLWRNSAGPVAKTPFGKRFNSSLVARLQAISPRDYMMLFFPVTCTYLGFWQIRRRKWKLGLLEELDKKQSSPGTELPADFVQLTADRQHERFILRGTFDHSREMYIGPRSKVDHSGTGGGLVSSSDTIGVHVVTPFKLSGTGEEVLVSRGWVTRDQKASGNIHRPTGEQQLVGLYRTNEKGSSAKDYDKRLNMWIKRNIPDIAKAAGTMPYFFDEAESAAQWQIPNKPIAGQTIIYLRNEHFSYIITWFSLAAVTLLAWCSRHLRPNAGSAKSIHSVLKPKGR
ncbi:surfeit locus protein 1-like [Watersipora subatra]|uniref:surfeit locus protein 1-like n=1 Tax=Watersipora subatra TaxID=2589382 RepID=UPI00355BE00E